MNAIAAVTNLSHHYQKIQALQEIDLTIPAGNITGFIGPDGVGKSTLLALLAGVKKIQQGQVKVFDVDFRHHYQRIRNCPRIAYMPQGLGHNLYMTLTVFENIDFFGRLFGQTKKQRQQHISELLESTGLENFANRPAGKLSGGMKQKLGLCCALIHDPELLILDEPTTGVDPLSRRQFWELIARIRSRRENMSVLVATAYMDEAENFDWLVAMDEGKILATGTVHELKEKTQSKNLEHAFINLLPKQKRGDHQTLIIPPRNSIYDIPAIEARQLTRRFGDFTAVNNVNFRIQQGEIFGFLGSNGCGKTTTMKMLTGLLDVSEGEALLFGDLVDVKNIEHRRRVGYMSQSFSLYNELTVRQNLILHARTFHIPETNIPQRITEMLTRFDLVVVETELAEKLPIGIRQRLSLAVAVIHKPEMLILDEPTSGVDPIARDRFWELLIKLSREDNVTIFISTHFMHEAERCDRISLMHAGTVLAQGTPIELTHSKQAQSLEHAFIQYLEAEIPQIADDKKKDITTNTNFNTSSINDQDNYRIFDFRRIWAYTRREVLEISRDPIRLGYAVLGPIILMIVFGYGITFDVEDVRYAVLDRDQTPQSRLYLENFSGSSYFQQQSLLSSHAEMDQRFRYGDLTFSIEIPSGFARDIKRGSQPEVAIWLDGTNPGRAEIAKGYIFGTHEHYLQQLNKLEFKNPAHETPLSIETRFRYNQEFKSVYSIVPGSIMMMLIWIPAMMTAAGVVREKEMGSITNLYATPVSNLEFLLGKQIPYIAIALVNFLTLLLLAVYLFDVPVKGSLLTLLLGGLIYVIATTGIGIFFSSFMKTQIAAIFGTAIMTTMPAVNFSGLFVPVSTLTSGGQVFSQIFPSSYFQNISLGTFTKSLGFQELNYNFLFLVILAISYLSLSLLLMRNQER